MSDREGNLTKRLSSLIGRRVSVRSSDHVDFDRDTMGTIVRIMNKGNVDWHYPPGWKPRRSPISILVKLEHPIQVSSYVSLPDGEYQYVLLVWYYEDDLLELLERGRSDSLSTVLYLLDEGKLSRMAVSPESDDLDIRGAYGIAKGVEVRSVEVDSRRAPS